jgi:hypothetical protein
MESRDKQIGASSHRFFARCSSPPRWKSRASASLAMLAFAGAGVMLSACGGGSLAGTSPGAVTVIAQPANANLFLGQTQQFAANVIGAANSSVTWNVNGIAGGNEIIGTVSAAGFYTASGVLPSPASVTVTAISVADPQASGSAIVTLEDNINVSVSPNPATVPTGGAQVFTASIAATGSPARGVTWSVNGVAGGNSSLGTIITNGTDTAVYTAPANVPSPPVVSVTATSLADSSKSGSANITIICAATNSITPPAATVSLGQTQLFIASYCLAAGVGITWDVNGIIGGNSSLGMIVNTTANAALYSAPADLPATNPVTIHATAGPATASAAVTLTSNIGVAVSPRTATVATTQRKSFSATVTNTSDTAVLWSINGTPNGNTAVGQICVSGSNPCAAPVAATSGAVDFLAPASVPTVNPVTLTATSHADNSKSGTATVTITGASGGVSITVSPVYAFVAPSGAQLNTMQFFAFVTGSSNANVTWTVQSGVAGQGCGGTACGSVNASGLYTAPSNAPSPNAIVVTATSGANPTKSASATIAITSGPAIEIILPSSVMAGAVEGFPLELQGLNFVPGSGDGASAILINGVPRATTCANAETCSTALNPADVQSPASLIVQMQNPAAPGALSNPVPFVVVPFDVSEGVISLSAAQTTAAEMNIVVTEPTTAAAASPLDVDLIGFLTGGNNCGIGASPLTITRPASGFATVSLCIRGNGLDPSFSYAFISATSAPPGGDIAVQASAIAGLFPNMIELDLQISSVTLPGVRTLFITDLNGDRAASTGMLEVK